MRRCPWEESLEGSDAITYAATDAVARMYARGIALCLHAVMTARWRRKCGLVHAPLIVWVDWHWAIRTSHKGRPIRVLACGTVDTIRRPVDALVLASVALGALALVLQRTRVSAVDGTAVGAALARLAALAQDARRLRRVVLVVCCGTVHTASEGAVCDAGVLVELSGVRGGWQMNDR